MSYSHIKLKKIKGNEKFVTYEILCFDFEPRHIWKNFGTIDIDKINSTYVHKDNQLWEKNKIFPIDAFEVPIEKRKELSKTIYKGYSSARWALNVYNFIKQCLENKIFPEEKDLVT